LVLHATLATLFHLRPRADLLVDDSPSLVASWARRLAGPFREFGGVVGGLYLVDRLLKLLSPTWGVYPYAFVVQPIPDQPLLPPALSKNIGVERLTPSGSWLDRMAVPAPVMADRFARGACGIAVLRKGQLTGYAWWTAASYPEQEVRCNFVLSEPAQAVFDFDVHVMPEHRMGLGFMSVWHAFVEELRRDGVKHSYSRISRFNLASLRAHARLGAQPIGRAIFVRVGALTLAMMARFPFVSASLGDGCRLRLRLGMKGVGW
jgi:hypothetical protein